ncbi:MAG: pyocin knob domain-containing protein [Chitinophagaceae bacterium]
MKKIIQKTGLRQLSGDDLLLLQKQALMMENFYSQFGDFIFYGCEKKDNTYTPGLLLVNGKYTSFEGYNIPAGEEANQLFVKHKELFENVPYKLTNTDVGYATLLAVPCNAEEQGAICIDTLGKEPLLKHIGRTDNPHGITKLQVGLGNVENTSDKDKPVSEAQQKELDKMLNKDGTTPMTGTLLLADGGFVFNSDGGKDTGIVWLSDGKFATKNDGVQRATFEVDGRISGVANPTGEQDVATKGYADKKLGNMDRYEGNLNDCVKDGTYGLYVGLGAGITNYPAGFSYGTMIVISGQGFITQIINEWGNGISDRMWIRTRRDTGDWGNWIVYNPNMQVKAFGFVNSYGSIIGYSTYDGSALTCSKTNTGTYRIYSSLIVKNTIALANTIPGIDANISAGVNGNGQILIYAIRNSNTFIDTYFSFMFI